MRRINLIITPSTVECIVEHGGRKKDAQLAEPQWSEPKVRLIEMSPSTKRKSDESPQCPGSRASDKPSQPTT